MQLSHYDTLAHHRQKNSNVNTYFRFSILIILSLAIHAALLFGIKYNNVYEPVISSELDLMSIDIIRAKPTVEPTIEKQTKQQKIRPQQKRIKKVVKQEVLSIKPVEIEEQSLKVDVQLNTEPSVPTPEFESQAAESVLSKEVIKPTGAELINRAIEFVHTESENEKTIQIFNPLTRNLANNALRLKISQEKKAGISSYIGSDGRTRVTFTSADGKVICAEIREKDPLDEFDTGMWYMLLNGCGE